MSDAPREVQLSVPVMSGKEKEYVARCLDSGWVSTSGDYIPEFEAAVRELTGTAHAVACQSGTAAIHVALRLAGVGVDDEVIVPSLTFIATVNPVAYLGAHPVFIGCDDYMNLDPALVASFLAEECERTDAGPVNKATGRRIAAIVPVHIFGNPVDMAPILDLAREWGVPVVEDGAESLGSSWTSGPLAGRHCGTVGLFGCISFNANKIITTGGGGMILTDDGQLAQAARHLTTTAKVDPVRFVHDEVGYNYRMTNIQAAMGVAQIATLADRIEAKRRARESYTELLGDVDGIRILDTPAGTDANNWFFSAVVDPERFGATRDQLIDELIARGIHSRPVWHLNHRQSPYTHAQTYRVERAEWFGDHVLNLPCTHTLTSEDIAYVCDAIRQVGAR